MGKPTTKQHKRSIDTGLVGSFGHSDEKKTATSVYGAPICPPGFPTKTDAQGTPLADAEASDNLYDVLRDGGEFTTEKLFPQYEDIESSHRLDDVA